MDTTRRADLIRGLLFGSMPTLAFLVPYAVRNAVHLDVGLAVIITMLVAVGPVAYYLVVRRPRALTHPVTLPVPPR